MPDARSRILASLRRSLEAGRYLPPALDLPPPAAAPEPDRAALLAQFQAELEKLGGKYVAERAGRLPELLAQLVRERQAESVLAWRAESLPVPGLLDALRREGLKVSGAEVQPAEPARSQRLAEIEPERIGLTGVDAALADTGTLALRSGPGRSRLASLSVRAHLAVFTPEQVYRSWAAWWAALPRPAAWVGGASQVALITGPSRTADIEMTLTVGVHGPAEVIAVCVLS